MSYKIGDKVKIVEKRTFGMNDNGLMDKYLGKYMTIKAICDDYKIFNMIEDDGIWIWNEKMFQTQNKGEQKMHKIYHKEMLKKMGIKQVIHNDDATIVILNDGRKGVAVRDKSEQDYPAFGFAMAYAYAMGTDGNKSQFKKNMKKIIK